MTSELLQGESRWPGKKERALRREGTQNMQGDRRAHSVPAELFQRNRINCEGSSGRQDRSTWLSRILRAHTLSYVQFVAPGNTPVGSGGGGALGTGQVCKPVV